jgi:hypothetical protein
MVKDVVVNLSVVVYCFGSLRVGPQGETDGQAGARDRLHALWRARRESGRPLRSTAGLSPIRRWSPGCCRSPS